MSISLDQIPKRVRKKLAHGTDLNMAQIARDLGVNASLVNRVFYGLATSQRVKTALEAAVTPILADPNNKYGFVNTKAPAA